MLEGESGFNDPVSISLMIAVVAFVSSDHATVTGSAVHLVQELGLGLVGGVVGAGVLIVLLKATPQLEEALQSIAVLVTVVVIGAATAVVHGSGFLAVYVAGLLFADRWAAQDGTKHAIPESVSAAAEPSSSASSAPSTPPRDWRRSDRRSSPHSRHVLLASPCDRARMPESQPLHPNRAARGHARRAEGRSPPPPCRLRRARSTPADRPHRSGRAVGHGRFDPRTGMGPVVHHIQTSLVQCSVTRRGPPARPTALARCAGGGRQLHRDPEADEWVRRDGDEAARGPVEVEGDKEEEGEHSRRDEDGDDAS